MKITVLFNQVTSSPIPDESFLLAEEGAREDAELIAKTLEGSGFTADIFELTPATIAALDSLSADLFFNLCDGIGNLARSEAEVPKILDKKGSAYTGSDSHGLLLTTDKEATKKVFEKEDIPTPRSFRLETIPKKLPPGFNFPLIVKPMAEDCSLGITLNSVVDNFGEFLAEAKRLLATFSEPVLAEEYIDGRELNVAILDRQVLPISEIKFGSFFEGKPKIVDFAAKWEEESPNCLQTVGVCPADLPAGIAEKIGELSLRAYQATGGRDYGRVDLRLSRWGEPYFLEVNLNPDISLEAGFFRSAKAAGMSYQEMVKRIVESACQRAGLVIE